MSVQRYIALPHAAKHTCFDDPSCDGTLRPVTCAGCEQANQLPCVFCGYGHVFSTHHAEAHMASGDLFVIRAERSSYGFVPSDAWIESPHIYLNGGVGWVEGHDKEGN
jgi:hypothetical protein